MKNFKKVLLAIVLVLMSVVLYQQHKRFNQLNVTINQMQQTLDLSVLNSCGIITDGNGHGSCVAIRSNLILTAGHCVRDFPNAWIEIGGVKYEIKNKWRSPQYDVGFVTIDSNLPYLELGQVPKLLQEIYIVGAPHNRAFENTITQGMICKLDIKYVDSVVNWNSNFVCDAMDWCGGSGGPILDIHGNILGIYVGLFSDVDNFNVCVPVSIIKEVLEEYNTLEKEIEVNQ